MVAYYACRPPPPPTLGVKKLNSTFSQSQHGHIAYQVKSNHEYSNMVTNILPTAPLPRTLGSKGQIQILQIIVMLHIKLKGIANAAIWLQIFCPQPIPPFSPQKVKTQLFQNMVMLHIKGSREYSKMVATAYRGTINMKQYQT